MDEKVTIALVFVIGLIILTFRVHSIIEAKKVSEMERICSEEYHLSYSHHDFYHFWCINNSLITSENLNLGMKKVLYNDQWHRNYELHQINLSVNYTKN